MEIILEQIFIRQLQNCPKEFQNKFRKAYQQLKAVDKPTEVKGVYYISTKFYKLIIDDSRISIKIEGKKLTIGMFFYNQFYNEQ